MVTYCMVPGACCNGRTIWSFGLCLIEILPESKLIKEDGIKKERFFLYLDYLIDEFLYIVSKPPIPDPTITPDLKELLLSASKPESSIASSAAINPNVMDRSIFLCSLDLLYLL